MPSQTTLIAHELATGVLGLFSETGELTLSPPYPAPLQQGFDRLTWFGQQRTVNVPQSIAELLRWCSDPFTAWPTFAGQTDHDWEGCQPLLQSGLPTYYCQELHCPSLNVADELTQNEAFTIMLNDCRDRQDQNSYVAYRQFLIENPLVETRDLLRKLVDFPSATVQKLLHASYEPIPDTYAHKGHLCQCGSCGYAKHRLIDNTLVCENDVCRLYYPHVPASTRAYSLSLLRLKRSFRRFITYPGLAELRLTNKLRQFGLGVDLWPHFDRYDLHVSLPDGSAWAVDVKDWSSPFLLGEAISKETFVPSDDYTRFLFVIPMHRLKAQKDYVRAVQSRCPNLKGRAEVLSEGQFLRQLKKHLTGR